MLTKNRLGRTRTIVLTIVALTGLVGMTLQPVLARTPDVAAPAAAAVSELEVSALIDQLRALIARFQALIEELENAPETAPAPEEDDADQDQDVDDGPANDLDESKEDDVNDESVDDVSVDEPDQESVDEPDQESVDDNDDQSKDDESQD